MPQLELSHKEIYLLKSALQETIEVLQNRFEVKENFKHAAIDYENLNLKLFEFADNLPDCEYFLIALKKPL